jgi:hypothetical protein
MNKLLIAASALVTVFSMPASAALTGPGSPPWFRDTPDVSRNTEANPEHHQVPSTEQRSQSSSAAIGEFNDCHFSDSHDITCE